MKSGHFPKTVAVAIPAYRAENELKSFLPHLKQFIPASQITVLIDGEYDNSSAVCQKENINFIVHKENRGKGAALQSLFRHLHKKYEWLITMDADGQHAPEDLINFLDVIEKDRDNSAILLGSRPRIRSTMPFHRRFSNSMTSRFISLVSGQKIEDSQCGYRAYRCSSLSELHSEATRFEMESEIIIRAAAKKYKLGNVPVTTNYNGETSHISHVADTFRWINAVLSTMISVRQEHKTT